MSATFKLAKKKFSQHDLRKMMHEQKATKTTQGKIDSPLAKYNDLGQLTCILCQSVVRSDDVWKVHLNAKQHRQNVELAKQLKNNTDNFTTANTMKRPATPPPSSICSNDQPATKKLKGILKNGNVPKHRIETIVSSSSIEKGKIPNDFFDSKIPIETTSFFEATLQKTSIRKDLLNIRSRDKKLIATSLKSEQQSVDNEMNAQQTLKDDILPEGFFDDPVKDAKARNLEYKDPIEEEWERFQREIKAASTFSNAIIAEDQEESTTERQIDEIDEQIRNWSRVLRLEKKKEQVVVRDKNDQNNFDEYHMDVDSDDENDEFDEFLDWRSKKSSHK